MSLRILGPVRAIAMAMVVPVLVAVACSQTDPGFGTAASEKGRDQMDSSNETPMPIASPTPAYEVSDAPIPRSRLSYPRVQTASYFNLRHRLHSSHSP